MEANRANRNVNICSHLWLKPHQSVAASVSALGSLSSHVLCKGSLYLFSR